VELPFASRQFDLAICTVSVEYLINPVDVFKQVARVLKPGSPFIATFSERWFPPKVIQVRTELHPFKRMGLVFCMRCGVIPKFLKEVS
jgi:SAM-dependent methyltransferase